MEKIEPIHLSRFVPIPYKGEGANRLMSTCQQLKTGGQKPLVIFLARQTLEFPLGELPVIVKVIKLPKGRIPSGPEYAEIKRSVFDYLSSFVDPSLIGLCSSKGDDICYYVAARWIIEERDVSPQQVLSDIRKQYPPGIIKKKYLQSLSEIYDVQLLPPENSIQTSSLNYDSEYAKPMSPQFSNLPQYSSMGISPAQRFISRQSSTPIYPPNPVISPYGSPQLQISSLYPRMSSGPIGRTFSTPGYPSRSPYAPMVGSPHTYQQHYSKYSRDDRSPLSDYESQRKQLPPAASPEITSPPNDSPHPSFNAQERTQIRNNITPSSSYGSQQSNDSFITLEIDPDDRKLHKLMVSDFSDPIINAIGSSVSSVAEQEIRTEFNKHLGNNDEFYLRPFLSLNRGTMYNIKEDKRCYCFMQQPEGKRCYLFIRGTHTFLIGEPGFIRSIHCFVPDHRNPSQSLVFSIFEGILYREHNSPTVNFLICDVINYETSPQFKYTFARRFQHADEAVNDSIKLIKENSPLMQSNDIVLQLRFYYRLKYMNYISQKKNPSTKGYIFTPKLGIIDKQTPLYYFNEFDKPVVSLKLEVNDNECYGKLADDIKVVKFTYSTDALRRMSGRIIDIEYNYVSKSWSLKCLSTASAPMKIDEFVRITDGVKQGQFTEDELVKEIHEINHLPQYVEEELAKKKNQ